MFKAFCLLRMSDFNLRVIQGGSAVQTRYSFSGIRMSRPVQTTSENVFHISSQLVRGAKSNYQSKRFRYLPIAALERTRRSRFVMVFLELLLRFPCNVVAITILRSDRPNGAKALGAVSRQYQIEGGVFTSWYFHDFFEAKMPQKTTNVQTVKVPSYKDATGFWILRLIENFFLKCHLKSNSKKTRSLKNLKPRFFYSFALAKTLRNI